MSTTPGADPGFDQGGGAQIVTGLKLPFWGLSFVEFWCWGLIFGGQGGPGPQGPPGSAPAHNHSLKILHLFNFSSVFWLDLESNVTIYCHIPYYRPSFERWRSVPSRYNWL